MTCCIQFLEGISQINFTGDLGKKTHLLLLASAYQTLKAEHEKQRQSMGGINREFPENSRAAEKLHQYREKQEQILESIRVQMDAKEEEAKLENFDLNQSIEFSGVFIAQFARLFRNVQHLANTLSDAPPEIKKLQTQLVTQIFLHLNKSERESQIHTLTINQIHDMLKHALETYARSNNAALRSNCQQIVQMGIFELIRRDCEKITSPADGMPDYNQYSQFLNNLLVQLPDVEYLDILDNLSEYRCNDGQNLSELFFAVEKQLCVADNKDWKDKRQIQVAKCSRALLHKLRFGQEDRREYIAKRQEKMVEDLFWARDIRDIEQFMKKGNSDTVFKELAENRYLEPFWIGKQNVDTFAANFLGTVKLACAIEAVRSVQTPRGGSYSTTGNQLDGDVFKVALNRLKQSIKEECKKPLIEVGPDSKIYLTFVYFDEDKVENLLKEIKRHGGFGHEGASLVTEILPSHSALIMNHLHTVTESGKTLQEIKNKLFDRNHALTPERNSYQQAFTLLESNIEAEQGTQINKLELCTSDELLLRKLLELNYFYKAHPPAPHQLTATFERLKSGDSINALKQRDLENWVDNAYIEIAGYTHIHSQDPNILSTLEKAIIIRDSSNQKQAKRDCLNAALNEDLSDEERIEHITAVYLDEYKGMSETLEINSVKNDERLKENIRSMACDIVKLMDRTNKGLPVLTEEEQNAYFEAIRQIAEAIKPYSISDMQFKLHHSLAGEQAVQVFHPKTKRAIIVPLQLGPVPLPYSLIKSPESNDFIFSFGGSRGIVAPFLGLDEAYAGMHAEKQRLFTNSRLLGVGQYGTVKEVESLLTGLNQILKKGYVHQGQRATFKESARQDLKTRAITARDDLLYETECILLQTLSKAEHAKNESIANGTQYWLQADKVRQKGKLFKRTSTPTQYAILAERAKGDTFADTAKLHLNQFTKTKKAYHNPSARRDTPMDGDLHETLALARAIVGKAIEFQDLGFAHNDIKPENFLYKRNPNGSYSVRFIDWATGGFSQAHSYTDNTGRIHHGINPTLEILHGSRNGTLPYICPNRVLGDDRALHSTSSKDLNPQLNTVLVGGDPTMDNWALTAMTFGICNRQAYFEIVKGRLVEDYLIPGILDKSLAGEPGLSIVNPTKFNRFFACEARDNVYNHSLATSYSDARAVMFIPGNKREGEPLHLYHRLKMLIEACRIDIDREKFTIITDIQEILATVHDAISSGNGLTKEALDIQLEKAQDCLKRYEKLQSRSYREETHKIDKLQDVINAYSAHLSISANDLLKEGDDEINQFEVLCTYPNTPELQQEAIRILDKALTNAGEFKHKFLVDKTPCHHLLVACIATGQTAILATLLAKITYNSPEFIQLVTDQGLLHFALQEGMTDIADLIIEKLIIAGSNPDAIFNLLLKTYDSLDEIPYINWKTNALHIAIRNNDKEQLDHLLTRLTPGHEQEIYNAMHQCALFSNPILFDVIKAKYNQVNSAENVITAEKILSRPFPPDNTSSYHLFLQDEATIEAIDWDALENNNSLAKAFLLDSPAPCLIAAQNGNITGLKRLIALGDTIHLSTQEWQQLFSQTDNQGKNLLNHLLEKQRVDYLAAFFGVIRNYCSSEGETFIIDLLTNSHPLNPLQNFLASTNNTDHQFNILTEVLNLLSAHFEEDPTQQETRLKTLLVQKEWLIEQACEPSKHAKLRALLVNSSLAIHYQALLFEQLSRDSQQSETAHIFYNTLLSEVRPKLTTSTRILDVQATIILRSVAEMRGDVNHLILSHADELNQLENELKRESDLLSAQIEETRKVARELEETKAALDAANREKNRLTEEALQTIRGLQERTAALETQVKQVTSQASAERELLISQLAQPQKEILRNRERIVELEEMLTAVKNENLALISRLDSASTAFREEKALLSRTLESQGDTIALATAEIERLKALLNQAQSEIERSHLQFKTTIEEILQTSGFDNHFQSIVDKTRYIEEQAAIELANNEPITDKTYQAAAQPARDVVQQLRLARVSFLENGSIADFKGACIQAIHTAEQSTLSNHRGMRGKLAAFANAILSFFTLGGANVINKVVTGRWKLFDTRTDSLTKLEAFEKTIETKTDTEENNGKLRNTAPQMCE